MSKLPFPFSLRRTSFVAQMYGPNPAGDHEKTPHGSGVLTWYTRQDSNLWPSAPQADALSS